MEVKIIPGQFFARGKFFLQNKQLYNLRTGLIFPLPVNSAVFAV